MGVLHQNDTPVLLGGIENDTTNAFSTIRLECKVYGYGKRRKMRE